MAREQDSVWAASESTGHLAAFITDLKGSKCLKAPGNRPGEVKLPCGVWVPMTLFTAEYAGQGSDRECVGWRWTRPTDKQVFLIIND